MMKVRASKKAAVATLSSISETKKNTKCNHLPTATLDGDW